MAGLTQRSTEATRRATEDSLKTATTTVDGADTPRTSSPPVSSSSIQDNAVYKADLHTETKPISTTEMNRKSLQERSKIPNSFYVTFGTIVGLQYFSGMWRLETLQRWYISLKDSSFTVGALLVYTRDFLITALSKSNTTTTLHWTEYVQTTAIATMCLFLFFVFVVAPARAGFWTGRRARRHLIHRYMGISFLVHYALAWVEYFTNYEQSRSSYLIHIVALNGIIQGSSAYFSFKVLPELNDPGYYSDKAVLSRSFVHENIFYTTMAVFGSIYYNSECRQVLRSNLGGRIVEAIYIFWPYVLVRPWFPLTRFSDAGQTYKGRTDVNKRFYEIAVTLIKFFYLWAKYFLGFYINFMIYMDFVKEEHWRVIHGMLLLNAGTVSLAVFLHTLRFKKVLPAKFTMSVYLVQIYLSFMALPMVVTMILSHPKLLWLCVAGIACNMTRNRKIHAVWCGVAMALLTTTNIEW